MMSHLPMMLGESPGHLDFEKASRRRGWREGGPERARGLIARPGRFELPTPGSVDQCSIQLSYGRLPSTGERTILGARPLSKGPRAASQTLQGPRATVTRAPLLDSA